jgi:hypothetical protein
MGLSRPVMGLLYLYLYEVYRAFWNCKGTFGGTWGLKPMVVHWICTILIRPILTFISTVWCPGVSYNVSRMELSILQKSACLAVTGVSLCDG